MENVCRVCAKSNIGLMDIYSPFGEGGLRPADLLIECVDCNVHPNDPFPKKICLTCVVATKKAFEFKRRYERSHQQFCELSNIKTLPNPESAECEERKRKPQEEEPNEDDTTTMEMLETRQEVDCIANDNSLPYINTDPMDNNNDVETHFCESCGEGFLNNKERILHSLIHYNLDYNQCPYCPKKHKTRQRLKEHVVVHAGEWPYKCPYCPKQFYSEYYRYKHVLLHSVCVYCSKSFKTDELLQKHLRLHFADRPIQCPHCLWRFREAHIATTHSSERPFKCPCCLRTFKMGDCNLHRPSGCCPGNEKNTNNAKLHETLEDPCTDLANS